MFLLDIGINHCGFWDFNLNFSINGSFFDLYEILRYILNLLAILKFNIVFWDLIWYFEISLEILIFIEVWDSLGLWELPEI